MSTLSGGLWDEAHAERPHDLHDGIKTGIAILRERLVETLATKAGLFRQLHHPVRTSGDPDHVSHVRRIVATLFKGNRQILCKLRRSFEVISGVVVGKLLGLSSSGSRCHNVLSQSWKVVERMISYTRLGYPIAYRP